MLIAPLGWNFKIEYLSFQIVKMSFIVWLITELSEAVIEIYTTLNIAVLEVLRNISTWICNGILTSS